MKCSQPGVNQEYDPVGHGRIFHNMKASWRGKSSAGITGAIILTSIACTELPVAWSDVAYSRDPIARVAADGGLVPDAKGCSGSVRSVSIDGVTHAVWWSVRNDSSSILRYATKTNGKWMKAVSVDTTDSSSSGCDRIAPALHVDGRGNIYLAYFLEPATGSGIFFSHQMDNTGFHDPVSIAFGNRPSASSIAASGDRIAVAYQEPNSGRGEIWVALSRNMGHIFEHRIAVSSPSQVAGNPQARLSGTQLEIGWQELIQADSITRSRLATRTGIWK